MSDLIFEFVQEGRKVIFQCFVCGSWWFYVLEVFGQVVGCDMCFILEVGVFIVGDFQGGDVVQLEECQVGQVVVCQWFVGYVCVQQMYVVQVFDIGLMVFQIRQFDLVGVVDDYVFDVVFVVDDYFDLLVCFGVDCCQLGVEFWGGDCVGGDLLLIQMFQCFILFVFEFLSVFVDCV